jgi:hypothetical protein
MSETPPALACDLGALSDEERVRRSSLARRTVARFLSFEPSSGPVWLRLGDGPGVKEFLAAAGLGTSPPGRAP